MPDTLLATSMVKFHMMYHSPCPDGCFAAFAASMWFERNGVDPLGSSVRWQPMDVIKPASDQFDVDSVDSQDEVFLMDYTGNPTFVLELASRCSRCTVLDHHQTALTKLHEALAKVEAPSSLKLVLDMNRSGAMIALDYFSSRPFPLDSRDESAEPLAKRPHTNLEWTSDYGRLFRDESEAKRLLHIFRLVEDADIWHWWLEGSHEFHAGFAQLKLVMNPTINPKLFDTLRALKLDEVKAVGAANLAETQRAISSEVERTIELVIKEAGGIRCLGVITERGDLRSAMGNQIAMKSKSLGFRGFGCVIYSVDGLPEGKIKLSVRALEGESSLEITEVFGGGGHKGASSCNVDLEVLESWKIADTVATAVDQVDAAVPEVCPPVCTKGLLMNAYRCSCCKPVEE